MDMSTRLEESQTMHLHGDVQLKHVIPKFPPPQLDRKSIEGMKISSMGLQPNTKWYCETPDRR